MIGASTSVTCSLAGDQCRTLPDQVVRALGSRIERRARHGEHLASLLEGEAGGDQRSRAARRLDDDDTMRKPRDDAVAPRKIPSARLPGERHFAQRRATLDEALEERAVLVRVDALMPTREHRNRARGERGPMRARIDAARQVRRRW